MSTSIFKELRRKRSDRAGHAAVPVVYPSVSNQETANGGLRVHEPVVPLAYDLSLLQGMVGEDSPALREIVQKFIRNTSSELDRLERAVAAYDLPATGAQAHRFKSQVKLFGLEKAAGALHQLEQAGRGTLPPADPAVLQQHAEEVKAVFEAALRELVRNYPAA